MRSVYALIVILSLITGTLFLSGCGTDRKAGQNDVTTAESTAAAAAADGTESFDVTKPADPSDTAEDVTEDVTEEATAAEQEKTDIYEDARNALVEKYPLSDIKFEAILYEKTLSDGLNVSSVYSYPRPDFGEPAEKSLTVNLFGQEFTGEYEGSETDLENGVFDLYNIDPVKIGIFKYRPSFSVYRSDKSFRSCLYIPYDFNVSDIQTEEQLFDFIKSNIIPDKDCSTYESIIITNCRMEDGHHETFNGFHRIEENETLWEYEIIFLKSYEGFVTSDKFKIRVFDGVIGYQLIGNPTEKGFFEKAAALACQDKEIVRDYIESNLFEKYELVNVDADHIVNSLVNAEGKASVLARVTYTFRIKGDTQTDEDGSEILYSDVAIILITPVE